MYQYKTHLKTPFFKSMKYNGFPPSNCLLLTWKDYEKIKKYGEDSEIIFHVNFKKFSVKEVRKITIEELNKLIEHKLAKVNHLSIGKVININKRHCDLISQSK
ncbi:MAG: hypothetical protein ACOCP8_01790 [archaeon]